MMINAKKMSYLIERITKYYMAIQAGFNDHNNIHQLKLSIELFDKDLLELSKYNYEGESDKVLADIKHYWPIAKNFYLSVEKRKLTNITYISAQYLESSIAKLEYFHSKNQ